MILLMCQFTSRYEGDLVAKCYFHKSKLVWEVLEGGLKSKIEIQWSDIMGLKADCPDDGPGTMTVVVLYNLCMPEMLTFCFLYLIHDFLQIIYIGSMSFSFLGLLSFSERPIHSPESTPCGRQLQILLVDRLAHIGKLLELVVTSNNSAFTHQ